MAMSSAEPAVDSLINTDDGLKYWEGVDADINGMLGGIPSIGRIDLQGSTAFLAQLGIGVKNGRQKIHAALDGGAGIGRVTEGLLSNVAEHVDAIEPIEKFCDVLKSKKGVARNVFNVGLEHWQPTADLTYGLIWVQWCAGHLTDAQLVEFLQRCKRALVPETGLIVIKENNSSTSEDIFDPVDSSVTR
ncbi:hypothetical protein K4F52_000168 [Lecanicillium sp. MT-2017a]|nr:hypothetical protein K4F52_000168 [Lecanicillium sp. MT-2017a]